MYSTRVTGRVRAPRAAVYRALLDPTAVARWRVPDGMTAEVHEFAGQEGGRFRVSLTYTTDDGTGKTNAHTDTYSGHFARLVPDQQVVEVLQFETADADLSDTMTLTTTLVDVDDGTEVVLEHDGIPDAVAPADNELGSRMALANLAALVEGQV